MPELNISKTLAAKRREKGVTQDELAGYIGVSKASVSKWETGQSYPDITFLPQLAAYFNISVDELIDYKPQMLKDDIRRLYLRLSRNFAGKPYSEVMTEVRGIVKKYFACFPLLFYMGALMINYCMFAEDEKAQKSIIREAAELFVRVKSESGDDALCRKANIMEAYCCLILSEPAKTIELLSDPDIPMMNESNLLAAGYSMQGKTDKAREIFQVGIYQELLGIIQNLQGLLRLETSDTGKSEEIMRRIILLTDTFEIAKLHPSTMLNVYLTAAGVYATWKNTEKALYYLQKYSDAALGDIFPITLHGDGFFDRIDVWLSGLDLGTEAPRDEKTIKQSIIDSVAKNPAFAALSEHPRYKSIVQNLSRLGG